MGELNHVEKGDYQSSRSEGIDEQAQMIERRL